MIDRKQLEDFATRCRAAFEAMTPEQREVRLAAFPNGSCGDASELVGRVLVEATGYRAILVCGRGHPRLPPQQSHAWLELDGLILDLTYDQFPDTGLKGWVFERSSWHAQFTTERHALCLDPGQWLLYPRRQYAALQAFLGLPAPEKTTDS